MEQNNEPTWGYMTKEQYETREYIPGQLKWLEKKSNRSEYEKALYKKLKELQDERTE